MIVLVIVPGVHISVVRRVLSAFSCRQGVDFFLSLGPRGQEGSTTKQGHHHGVGKAQGATNLDSTGLHL